LFPVFDLDGTLLDSDEALIMPFLSLGVPRSEVSFGHVLADECVRLGITLDDYLARYDVNVAAPYPGVSEVVAALGDRWAVCSNKVRSAGVAELARLGWTPEVALFVDDFGGLSKSVAPVLAALVESVPLDDVVFVGDTDYDRRCALDAGVRFALAAWNPRAVAVEGDIVLAEPADLLRLLRF
jgi:HAD superfamily hydrolase (TIGR01549 family)